VRYVLSPQGEVVVDYRKKLPGRGVYTCFDLECVETAVKRGQFCRSLRGGEGPSANDLWRVLHDQAYCKALDLIGMARKAGQVVSGTRQVLSELQAGKEFGVLVRAADLSVDIAEKVDKAARRSAVPCFALFSKELLGGLLGKSERGVVALKYGSLAVAIMNELERLNKFAGEFNG
jgi:ribosomal protein L7Ae-like RNA K-turn-binding protein